jgi:hypothetical protein
MPPLSQAYLDQCPVEDGFRLRGLEMTRIEVFVDAAFAFAVTMLVVSVDGIPRNFDEMVNALKGLPAFVAAVAQLVWIWHAHSTWSRRFGLEDAMTVLLSSALLVAVLTWIYPLRVMAQGMFAWFTGDWLAASFALESLDQLRFMFVFLGIGFGVLCGLFTLMYAWARRRGDELRLSGAERYEAQTVGLTWLGSGVCALLSALLALALPDPWVPFAGFGYAPIGAWIPWFHRRRWRYKSTHFPAHP